MSLILSQDQCAEARRMREEDDKTYAQVAKHFGVSVEDAKHAIAGTGDYAPPPVVLSPLDQMAADAEAHGTLDTTGGDPDIVAANSDRRLSEDEVDKLETIYRSGQYGFEEMAAALDPPVHWLTVQQALGERGWVRPDYKTITYSTATEEGKARFAREMSTMSGAAPQVAIEGDGSGEARARTLEKAQAKAERMAGAA